MFDRGVCKVKGSKGKFKFELILCLLDLSPEGG